MIMTYLVTTAIDAFDAQNKAIDIIKFDLIVLRHNDAWYRLVLELTNENKKNFWNTYYTY